MVHALSPLRTYEYYLSSAAYPITPKYYPAFSLGQELESVLAGWFWLGSEVAVKMLAKIAVIQILDRGFQGGLQTLCLARGLNSLPCEPLWHLGCVHVIAGGSSQNKAYKVNAR